ncbi:hypothetical protein QYM36_014831 [Artemia franciscana]|uniref:ADF-H domain-containing protein n=1 Tax=Artemia franciscana TaxID=6661 RepID=A0AA88KYN0_ARTSF|nr:hypothetical protein QYM36_014831 [Artemia franciscana]
MSGIIVDDNCKRFFDRIKSRKEFRYVIFYIKDETSVEVEKTGERNASYDDFLNDLMVENDGEKECRYGVIDFQYTLCLQGSSETLMEKLILVCWCPNEAKVKKKMLYASTLDALRRSLNDHSRYIQATDYSEASRAVVEAKLRSSGRF